MGTSAGSPGNNGPTIVVTPQGGIQQPSATDAASQAARERIAAGGSALPPDKTGQPRVPAGSPPGGQFAAKPAEGAAPGAGQGAPGAEAGGDKGGQPGGEQKPAEGQSGATGEETPEQIAEREAAEAAAALEIELPIMVPGEGDEEVPLTLTADSPETAAALQELVSDAVAGRQNRALVEQASKQLAQVDEMRDYSAADPVGFTLDMIGDDVETAEHLTLFMLAQPTLFERLKPQLTKLLQDPNELRALSGDMAKKRSDAERAATTRIEESRAVRTNLADVQATVAALLPAEFSEGQQKVAFLDCLRDLKEYADSKNLLTLPVHLIPTVLADRLTALGIDPEEAAAKAAVALSKRGGSSTSGRAALPVKKPGAAAPRTPPAKAPAKPNGKMFVANKKARQDAAAIPPAGAGSPGGAGALTPPRNADGSKMTTEQAVAWHRDRLKRGIKTY